MARSDTNPQLGRGYTELQKLASDALVEFGDFTPGSVNGQVGLMLLAFANKVIDEVRVHPYWDGSPLDYYEHPTDKRPIPDNIVKSGVLYYYAAQQGSTKAGVLGQDFIRTLNRELYNHIYGNGPLQLKAVSR